MNRRQFLLSSAAAAVAAPTLAQAAAAQADDGPYGPLQAADANGIRLPEGFASRVVATAGAPVGTTGYVWHTFPDGAACYLTEDGGWVYTSNSEVPGGQGGAGALRFDSSGEVVDAYRILEGTSSNCAGGKTPWGTWLSCEETGTGRVWECDPTGAEDAVVRPALGVFAHEAVAVDPLRGRLYLTEDAGDGRFYRFTPAAYPDLSEGVLEVLVLTGDRGRVGWTPLPDPSATTVPTRQQVAASKAFDGGEGLWYDAGLVYFTTKGDNRLWALDTTDDTLDVLYDAATFDEPPLTGVDNVTVSRSGDIYVAEDGGTMDLVLVTPDRRLARFLHVEGQDASEICGPAFDPSGTRLYFSSQRGGVPAEAPGAPGNGFGITYEVTGPFRTSAAATPSASPSRAPLATPRPRPVSASPTLPRLAATGAGSLAPAAGLGLLAGALALRARRGVSAD